MLEELQKDKSKNEINIFDLKSENINLLRENDKNINFIKDLSKLNNL